MKLSKMSKEELELLSYTKIAQMYLEENKVKMNTADLFHEVCNLLELSESEYQAKIADFFQTLTTSKDFILLNDGNWDLRANHAVKIAMDDIYEENNEEEHDEDDDYEDNDDEEETMEDDYDNVGDDDYEDDDYADLTIVEDEELEN